MFNKKIVPGLVASLIIAGLCFLVTNKVAFLGKLGPATLAILIGIFLGNTMVRSKQLNPGTKFAESKLLEFSVALLGFTATFSTIAKLGWNGLLFIIIQMTITIIAVLFMGRKLGFSQNTSMLMAGGNAVCGSSAIGAIAPVIKAKDKEKGEIITLVNLMGTVMLFVAPLVANLVFNSSTLPSGGLIGGTLQSVGQVVASASLMSPEIVQTAALFKIMRILMLIVVIIVFGKMANRNSSVEQDLIADKRTKFVPWYVIVFIIVCAINSLTSIPVWLITLAKTASSIFEVTALAAIGLRLDLRAFLKSSGKLSLFGLGTMAVQLVAAVTLIKLLHI